MSHTDGFHSRPDAALIHRCSISVMIREFCLYFEDVFVLFIIVRIVHFFISVLPSDCLGVLHVIVIVICYLYI